MASPNDLGPGIYESLVTLERQRLIAELAKSRVIPNQRELDDSEAAERLAGFVEQIAKRALRALPETGRAETATELTNSLLEAFADLSHAVSIESDLLKVPGSVLESVLEINPDGSAREIPLPLTSLLDTALLTNARGEPRLMNELRAEIPSSDSIDVIVAFIRWSGVRPLIDDFRRHCQTGKRLRILTTTYTNSTELKALQELANLGAEIRISYDVSSTRLHAKAWLFNRRSGLSTGYIGSSNLSYSAMGSGMEWNLRIAGSKNEDVLQKMAGVFETYWESGDFEQFEPEVFMLRTQKEASTDFTPVSTVSVRLLPFQERMLDQVWAAREAGKSRNLIVSATGTGKTVMAAEDYRRLSIDPNHSRLLFVAHREEILDQAIATFRHVLGDGSFGEKWMGGHKPTKFEHVFASIQSLTSSGIDDIDRQHFDVLIIDEFHHSAAPTYSKLLNHLQPRQLLGLTATPERADGLDILNWFGGEIAAELRIWDAIEQQYLVPFEYFGINDETDLRGVAWRKGMGYDSDELTNIYTGTDRWISLVYAQFSRLIGDFGSLRGIGFCVSVAHAKFMAQKFNEFGISSSVIVGSTPSDERVTTLRNLRSGILKMVFAVDVLNEGVDVPEVNTIMMLRPTDSATIFLQQLGRGLRKSQGKYFCTVLDFVGKQASSFRFDQKLTALTGLKGRELSDEAKRGFPFLPAGCSIELDQVARQTILDNLQETIPRNFQQRVAELRELGDVTLSTYLQETGYEFKSIYANGHSWTELKMQAGFTSPDAITEGESSLLKAASRLLHADDTYRLSAYRRCVDSALQVGEMNIDDRRAFRMLAASLGLLDRDGDLDRASQILRENPRAREEIVEILDALRARVDRTHSAVDGVVGLPLRLHATYSRKEIQAAFGDGDEGKIPAFREGVKWIESAATDIFLVTLNKDSKKFSPTTRYRDYAISRDLFHWESQSTTSAGSSTGQRYINQKVRGTNLALFVRPDPAANFRFLGFADYVSHSGSNPISFTLKLRSRLPGDLFSEFALAVA